mgnify:CR=1 FL=1|jgi:hypothetical protein
MKKKLHRLIEQGRFDSQVAFTELYNNLLEQQRAYTQAKQFKLDAKAAYRGAFQGKKPLESTIVQLLGEFRKAKWMQQYHKEEYKLANYALNTWVETFLSASEIPQAAKLVRHKLKPAPTLEMAVELKAK